ncbi:MAG: Gfo/Idh/MocA family oxidoreductase [Bacteroidetes bacterium]|nr:Gfo/Idh/MocA family oxidoreductase [Bacteroidota bacterium]
MEDRRSFIRKSTVAAVGAGLASSIPQLACSNIVGANSILRCGLIGCNGMGFNDLNAFLRQPNTECVALCDVDSNVLQKRIGEIEEYSGKRPAAYSDFRKLIDSKEVDVVIIGTPDHWHCLPFVYACQAGKSIYCEKPLGRTVQECNVMEAAVNRYKNVVQIGQWQRSDQHWQDAVEYVHSGKLGSIRSVKVWTYLDWVGNLPVVADSEVPSGVDYDFWLGPASQRPFNKNRFHFNFRWFWDYAGGLMTDWGVHLIDYALFGMKKYAPESVMCMGGKFAYSDDACETPDTQQALYDFGDFILQWDHSLGIDNGYYGRDHGVAYIGNMGTLVVDRKGWEVIPERKSGLERVELIKGDGQGLNNHMKNFVNAIRNGEALNCPVEIAAGVARASHLGNIAHLTGRRIYWDAEKRQIINDKEANSYLEPDYRAPWKLPTLKSL